MSSRTRTREQGVIARWSGDELLLLDTVADRVHQLNATAGLIWDRLADGASESDITKVLCERYEVNEDQARADVAATLHQLREQGLIS